MQILYRTNEKDKFGRYLVIFICPVCQNTKKMPLSNGKRDVTCGCVRSPVHTITDENRKLYECWVNMKTRCKNPNYNKAHRYSARGILLCEEWERFLPFQKWALENGYKQGLQIDRINNNTGYSPENCRWVDNKTNHRNSSSAKISLDIAEEIRKEYEKGETEIALSIRFLLSRRQINNIVKRRQWI